MRVISPYIGGGIRLQKVLAHPHVILTVMAAQVVGRPVKFALTRQHMFAVAGYRTPTIQRIQPGRRRDGRLTAIAHEVVEQSSTLQEYAEQTDDGHEYDVRRAEPLVPRTGSHGSTYRRRAWMRAPGECPGMFALESAMDELALACEAGSRSSCAIRNEHDD